MYNLKQLIRIGAFSLLGIAMLATLSKAQERGNDEPRISPNASVSQTIGTTEIMITYGRPAIKGRTYFAEDSQLAPLGTWWRTGANESAVITFSNDVMFGGEEVEAGTYSLYSIPGEDEWTIILNNKLSWGTQYDPAEDYLRVDAASVDNDAPMVEQFMIYFDNISENEGHLNLHWGSTKVAVPIRSS